MFRRKQPKPNYAEIERLEIELGFREDPKKTSRATFIKGVGGVALLPLLAHKRQLEKQVMFEPGKKLKVTNHDDISPYHAFQEPIRSNGPYVNMSATSAAFWPVMPAAGTNTRLRQVRIYGPDGKLL